MLIWSFRNQMKMICLQMQNKIKPASPNQRTFDNWCHTKYIIEVL